MGLLACLIASQVAAAARSAPPTDPATKAERIHGTALREAGAGRWDSALELWEAALALNPVWKYAFNQASGYAFLKRFTEAFGACERTRALGVPDNHAIAVSKTCDRVSAELLKTHALVELRVEPEGASVTRDGQPWAAPYRQWSDQGSSKLRVAHPGFEPQEQVWEHPIGQRAVLDIRLAPAPRLGGLVIRGTPAGATVRVGDRVVGALPEAACPELRPGNYRVTVGADGFLPFEQTVAVRAGATETLDATLTAEPVVAIPVAPVPPPRPRLMPWAWGLLGTGLAFTGAGAGLLVKAGALAEEVGTLDSTSADYSTDYQETSDSFDTYLASGWSLAGLGAAATVASVVLFVLGQGDPTDDAPSGATMVLPIVLPGGGGVLLTPPLPGFN